MVKKTKGAALTPAKKKVLRAACRATETVAVAAEEAGMRASTHVSGHSTPQQSAGRRSARPVGDR